MHIAALLTPPSSSSSSFRHPSTNIRPANHAISAARRCGACTRQAERPVCLIGQRCRQSSSDCPE